MVHPSPGHYSGTLVNGLLHHCKLPSMEISTLGKREEEDEEEENEDEDSGDLLELSSGNLSGPSPVIRPGIVHRLDKGTSGLLVVAKVKSLGQLSNLKYVLLDLVLLFCLDYLG